MSVPFVLAELMVTLCLSGAVWFAVEERFVPAGIASACAVAILALFLNLMRSGQGQAGPLPVAAPQVLSRRPS